MSTTLIYSVTDITSSVLEVGKIETILVYLRFHLKLVYTLLNVNIFIALSLKQNGYTMLKTALPKGLFLSK